MTRLATIASPDKLAALECRHGCKSPVVGIFQMPQGCVCFKDPMQALCMQHAVKAQSEGAITCIVDFRIQTSP